MEKLYYVYIISNKRYGTLYAGVTSNLMKRIWEHKNKIRKGFSAKYNLNQLVYYEEYQEIGMAISREKRIKTWPRNWKINLIERDNPLWVDLYSF